MCGRLNVTDSAGVRALCEQLDIQLWPEDGMRFSRFIRATDRVSIVFRADGDNQKMVNAIWWLLLEKAVPDGQFKPSRYTSFNTRYDKLNKRGSAGYQSYRSQRCVIPASGFGETISIDGKKYYHDMMVEDDDALVMGGLYRTWQYTTASGQTQTEFSCSVVTLPPHDKLQHIHKKASPLMLSLKDGSVQDWLDPTRSPESLDYLLTPKIRQPMSALPVDKPSTYQPIGESTLISADG